MNTRFEYRYRNASNYKQWGAVVFAGVSNDAMERRLLESLESGELFIADQVRVAELFFQDGVATQDDSCWHEFSSLELTTEEPDDPLARSIEAFVSECESAARVGWKAFDPRERELNRMR